MEGGLKHVVIVAGFWKDMPPGAMQGKCSICLRLIGFDRVSQDLLAKKRVVVTLCRECFQGYQAYRAGDGRELERIIDRVTNALVGGEE